MKPVQIVTIKSKSPLFKKDELAGRVELVNLAEMAFPLVSGKDIYEIGDKAVFILPDYCIPDTTLFEDFIKPGGDSNKSLLGKVNGEPRRIRAKKFTLSSEPFGEPVYSYGILLPIKVVEDFLGKSITENTNLEEVLGVYKPVEKEEVTQDEGGLSFPVGIYKTDEDNIYSVKNKISFPITLVGRVKEDGSSITLGSIDDEIVICSRKIRKRVFETIITGYREKTLLEKLLFWKKPDLSIYKEKVSTDPFVKYGLPLVSNGLTNYLIRGEISGGSLKGSGNKNNPASKRPVDIRAFGLDLVIDGIAVKQPNARFEKFCKELEIPTCEKVFQKEFNSFDEIIQECNNYFKDNLIEGIVVRDLNSGFSAKVMNLEYDSKK